MTAEAVSAFAEKSVRHPAHKATLEIIVGIARIDADRPIVVLSRPAGLGQGGKGQAAVVICVGKARGETDG